MDVSTALPRGAFPRLAIRTCGTCPRRHEVYDPRMTTTLPPAIDVARVVDQRVTLRGVDWAGYEALLAMRGESAVPRIAYLRGTVELMSPSTDHEIIKTRLARLLEAWTEEVGIDLEGYGSWTVKKKELERGAEADECYVFAGRGKPTEPEIAIEVNWSSAGIDKLEIWRGLGVGEVWMWRRGRITVHVLRGETYEEAARSEKLPQVDLAILCELVEAPLSQSAAVRELRSRLRSRT
jgi:Uma2 family endonuclease